MRMTEENIDREIKHLEELKRKIRGDKGVPRNKYVSNLDKKYLTYLKRANAKGFEFELTEAHFKELDEAECYYCLGSATGFDRVDSKKGYRLDNVVTCCWRCNMMKQTMPKDVFIAHVNQVAKVAKERLNQ